MRERENKKKVRRHISAPGLAIFMAAGIAAWWIGDYVNRKLNQNKPTQGGGIKPEGIFAEEQSKKPELEPETLPPETTDPLDNIQNADFTSPIKINVPDNCVPIPEDVTALHSGKLLRLDSTHDYSGYEGALGSFAEKNGSYKLRFGELEIQTCVVDAMNQMALAYETVTHRNDLLIYSTTAACGAEGSLYPDFLPDRETGYCVDIAIRNEDESISPLYSVEPWLAENAYLYGFVFSYSAADEEVTGIPEAPYHLRYVGKVHSIIMHEKGLTLAGYLDDVKSHTPDDPYTYHDGNHSYYVYYVPAGTAATDVIVPRNGNYEISGNNVDGFIVQAEGEIG